MIFKTLHMENIRSYERCTIEFPTGTSLFEGDVGSGKSTVLMAIEFALFGLGNQRGDALLRKGSKKGSVILSFQVGGNHYQIKRTLKRNDKDTIRQDKAILGVNDKKMQLSPSEIKEKILEILNFKEPPNPRAQSVIFRYAVYTPQEEMKFILNQKPDNRLETLRKAFGIEDYKIAVENAAQISKAIKGKITYLSGQISDLDAKRKELTGLQNDLADNEKKLQKSKDEKTKLDSILSQQKEELEELKSTESELKQIQTEIPHLEQRITEKNKSISQYKHDTQEADDENQNTLKPKIEKLEMLEKPTEIREEELKEKIKQIKETMNKRSDSVTTLRLLEGNKREIKHKLQDWQDKTTHDLNRENEVLTNKLSDLKTQLKSHEVQLQKIVEKIYTLKGQKVDINKKLENLDGLGDICPICESPLNEELKEKLKQERETKIRQYQSEIRVLKQVKLKGDGEIERDNNNIQQLETNLKEYERVIDKFNEISEIESKISAEEEKLSSIDEKLSLNMGENLEFKSFDQYVNELERALEKLKEYNHAQETLTSFRSQFNKNIEKIENNKDNIKTLDGQIVELREKISTIKENIKDLPRIVDEINLLQSIHHEIDKKFQLINEKFITTRTMIDGFRKDIGKLTDEIAKMEQLSKQLDRLKDYNMWLNDYLIPTLTLIEKHVMQNIHMEFDDNFRKWFNLLIDDPSKTGKIDEEFTPIIEQDGFQQEINYLSGGEKTSVALSYRLALNYMVQKVSTGMKSNLLIMDEPTDGFSKEQLFKIREILNELNYPQIIMVSHEKELESFADNVFQIEKVDGISQVARVN